MLSFRKIKLFNFFLLYFSLISLNSYAEEEVKQYPYISGKAIMEIRTDQITSNDSGVSKNNSFVNFEPYFSLNVNKNWTVQTNLKFFPFEKRKDNIDHPERYRVILSDNRGFRLDDEGLIVEQIKGQFQNEDMKFFFGKFNPTFGTAWKREKRIGVFTTDFTKDYQLREKIGVGGAALLENSELTANIFFNDNTGLSNSALDKRGKDDYENVAGNNGDLSSYSITFEGQDLFKIDDLFYNLGYRNIDVNKNISGLDKEKGLVAGLEYLIPVGVNSSLIPFMEIAKIDNLSGMRDRDATYITTALIFKYSSWNASVASVIRNIKQKGFEREKDSQLQYSVGYKFTDNIALDVSRMNLEEGNRKATLLGAMLSYVYEF